jgi:transposase
MRRGALDKLAQGANGRPRRLSQRRRFYFPFTKQGAGASAAYMPPYSPDLNPIEMVFSKLNAKLQQYRECTADKLWVRAGALIPTISLVETRNFLRNAGHATR